MLLKKEEEEDDTRARTKDIEGESACYE